MVFLESPSIRGVQGGTGKWREISGSELWPRRSWVQVPSFTPENDKGIQALALGSFFYLFVCPIHSPI